MAEESREEKAKHVAASFDIDPAPEPEAVVAPPKEEPKPTEPVKSKHPSWLVEQAKDLEIEQADIDASDPDTLGKMVRYAAKNRLKAGPSVPTAPASVPAAPAPVPENPDKDLDDMLAEAYDAKMIAVIRAERKRTRDLEAKIEEQSQKFQAQSANQVERRIDSFFDELNEAYTPAFGKGSVRKLAADADERHARGAVVQMMLGMQGGINEANFKRAVKIVAGERQPPKPAEPVKPPVQSDANDGYGVQQALEKRKKEWEEGQVAKPTQRKATEPNGRKKAEQAVAAAIAEMGGQGSSERTDIENEFL